MSLDLSDPLCTISPSWMRFLRAVDDRSRSSTDLPELSTVPATELAAGVQRVLADKIASGRLRPNERINQERVASELGVSRTGVREALRWLERDGLVRLEARRGAFVAAFAARDAAVRATRADIAGLRRLLAAMERAWRSDVSRAFALNRTFHERLCAPCENRLLLNLLAQVWSQQNAVRIFTLAKESDATLEERTNAEHRAIVDAYAARDGALAEELVRRHIVEAHEATAELMAGRAARHNGEGER